MQRRLIPVLLLLTTAGAAQIRPDELSIARGLLSAVRREVRENYHDPTRLGEFGRRCDTAERLLPECRSFAAAQLIIAQVLLDFNDTHTQLYPPRPRDRVVHPWEFHAVGEYVFVSAVEPASEAERKGLRVGDRIVAIDGMPARAANCWLMRYFVETLAPRRSMKITAQAPGGEERSIAIAATVVPGRAVYDLQNPLDLNELLTNWERERQRIASRTALVTGNVVIWKLERFAMDRLDQGLRKIRRARALVVDLRSNTGGSSDATRRVLDALFAERFSAFEFRGPKIQETVRISGRGEFQGDLVVLIDRNSASAAESFARVVQMRRRGKIVGERSAGAGGLSRIIPITLGDPGRFVRFSVGVTVAREVMPDGSEIEGPGVTPDVEMIPTHEDLYSGRDPTLARALSILGVPISPEEAGRLTFSPEKLHWPAASCPGRFHLGEWLIANRKPAPRAGVLDLLARKTRSNKEVPMPSPRP